MTKQRDRIFISYAWKDDQPFVERLYHDLQKLGYDPWMDKKNMPSRGRTLPQEVVSRLNDCDRVVAVIGPEALKSEACQAEREYALDKGKVFTAILRLGDYKSLPPEVSKFFVPDVRVSRPYEAALDEFLRVLADPPVIPGRLFDVPAPPAHLQHRPEEVRALCEALTAKKLKPIAVTSPGYVGLQGMGGVGKTVVAALAARDYTVRRTFKDGIIWLTFGQHPDVLAELRQAGAALREDIADWTSETLARTRLSQALESKECLLILDDLWNASDAESFRRTLSASCTLLVTTRNLDVVTAIGAEPLPLGLLTDDQAIGLLARWSGQSAGTLPAEARRVARECGNLPLALAMIGAMVGTDSRRWANVLHKLESADLEKVRQQFPDYPYPNLMLAIEVSVEALGPPLRQRYLDLAVFPEDTLVPEPVFETYWAPLGFDKYDVQDTLDRFVALSLGRRDDKGRISLHDLQSDYARKKIGSSNLHDLHKRLLAAYRQACRDGWHTGPNDGYFFERLAYHLQKAARVDELRELLADFNWIQAKLEATDGAALIADYGYLIELAPRGKNGSVLPGYSIGVPPWRRVDPFPEVSNGGPPRQK